MLNSTALKSIPPTTAYKPYLRHSAHTGDFQPQKVLLESVGLKTRPVELTVAAKGQEMM